MMAAGGYDRQAKRVASYDSRVVSRDEYRKLFDRGFNF